MMRSESPKAPQEFLVDLGIDEESINQLLVSTGAEISTVMWPAAKLLAADILLINIVAADLAADANFDGALELLSSVKNPDVVAANPRLAGILMDLCNEEVPAVGLPIYRERIERARARILASLEGAPA